MPSKAEYKRKRNEQRKEKLHHLFFSHPLQWAIRWQYEHPFPGCNGVPPITVIRYFLSGIANGVLWQRAKGLSYSFLMAIPPLLIFLFTLIAYLPVDGIQDVLLSQMQVFIPDHLYNRIANTVNDVMGHRHSNLLSFGFILSIILAANGMHGLLMSVNLAKNSIDRRPFFKRYALCIFLVFLLYILIVAILLLLVGYKLLIGYLIHRGAIAQSQISMFFISFGRWVILTFLTLLIICVVYYLAPVKKQRVGFFSIGSVLATLLFFGLSWGFQIYINSFNQWNILYGSIGTLLVIMMWLFLNCLVLLVGYEVNIAILKGSINKAEFERMRAERSAKGITEAHATAKGTSLTQQQRKIRSKRQRDLEKFYGRKPKKEDSDNTNKSNE